MRKLLLSALIFSAGGVVYAADANVASNTAESSEYSAFQKFDRQYSLGYAVTSGNLTNGSSGAVNNTQYVNLEVERLFNVGVWMDINANLLTYYSQNADPATPAVGTTTGSQPSFGGINAKVGYAFSLLPDHLLITPYGYLGRNTNLSSYTLSEAGSQTNLTQDYYWSFGAGARLEYRINNVFDVYLDQNGIYNASQAPVTQGFSPNDYYSYTSTLGAKFNVYRNLQLGAQAFYNNYYFTQSLVTANGVALVPQSSVGGLVSIGLTY